MINSKKKGSRNELEFAHICQNEGFKSARRTQQFCGNTADDSSDVIGLPDIHCEVKATQIADFYSFMAQAKRDSDKKGRKEYPVVFYHRNNKKWLTIMDLNDWFELYKKYLIEKKG